MYIGAISIKGSNDIAFASAENKEDLPSNLSQNHQTMVAIFDTEIEDFTEVHPTFKFKKSLLLKGIQIFRENNGI